MTSGIPPELSHVVGRWSGHGEGTWPSSGPFSYAEEMIFEDGGGGADFAFLSFAEHAWDPDSGTTLHRERGFWTADGSSVSVVLAHPIGVTEVAEGTIDGSDIQLTATRIERTSNGLEVTGYRRRYTFDGNGLIYEQFLATVPGQDPVRHVWATLKRTGAPSSAPDVVDG